ncbi:uncharacterized protein [Miscanthus floridulus]|uniref:uncharacterized protein n=1 Tax=Miscanthus floridulus TaxID=154761 RepID=UPI00345A82F4
MWVRVAAMQFVGPAKRWIQSIAHRLETIQWTDFCAMVRERFCRDQHELLLHQLFHIKQTGSVQEYVDQFVDLIEQLSAYTTNPDNLSYTTRFIDGLRDDIRAVILIQRPADLDAACSLALLQEEAVKPTRRKEIKRTEGPAFIKHAAGHGALPLPPPPPRLALHAPPAGDKPAVEERRNDPRRLSVDDKLQSLRSYRQARGLCMSCGEKWHQGHKCAPAIQLHALQEVWDLCQYIFDDAECSEDTTPVQNEQVFMLLSAAAAATPFHPRKLQFHSSIQNRAITILLDSGSTNSFLDTSVAESLSGVQPLQSPVSVKVASGASVACTSQIQCAEWYIEGFKFHSTLKILPIGTYDMIFGMDWLQAFSPMKVNWLQRWIQIPYGPENVVLQGALPDDVQCSLVQLHHISVDGAAQHLDQYQHLFRVPTELPPRRACDHSIPLLPRAQPVSVRPYRYSPALKSEIEAQVTEMLQSGLIRPSSSAFSSLVLLVRKKDNGWRLCVDIVS